MHTSQTTHFSMNKTSNVRITILSSVR